MSDRATRWKATWETRDVERFLALYAPDAVHASPGVRRVCPELGRAEVRGRAEIADYFRRALGRYAWLRFELATVTEQGDRAAIEYHRHSDVDGDTPIHVLELVEWNAGGLIRAVRVFHA